MTIPWLLKTTRRLCSTFTLAPCPRPFQPKTPIAFIFSTASPLVGLLKRINVAPLQNIVRSWGKVGGDDGFMAGLDGLDSAPQFRGLVGGAGCQKGRRWVKRDRHNIAAVPRQSCHTSRRRAVG
jgi:hypothetical protein